MLDNFRNAFYSIWNNKARSVLTVLGVVIGVASVTTLISLGEGLKNDVSGLIQGFGTNVVTVVSGKLDPKQGQGASSNPANFINGDILTVKDVDTIAARSDIQAVSPTSLVSGTFKLNDKTITATTTGVYPEFLNAFEVLKLGKGTMFKTNNAGNVVVLGDEPRQALFGDEDPIGRKVTLTNGAQSTEFEVIGTLAKGKSSALVGQSLDSFALIPFDTATTLNKNQIKITRIVAKGKDTAQIADIKKGIKAQLLANHDKQEDFTVLTQDDILDLFNTFLTLATTMVSAIAAISLVVGGIGIMNIMLVTVTERTREIGLRKAVGATKLAILWQFLIEAIVVTFVGSLIGLLISFVVGMIVSAKTELHPTITLGVIGIAVGVSVVVGVIFGLWPAIRAAQKDPIEALRYE